MEVSSTIFKVFGMTRPGIEPRSPGPLANTLPTSRSLLGWIRNPNNLLSLYQKIRKWALQKKRKRKKEGMKKYSNE